MNKLLKRLYLPAVMLLMAATLVTSCEKEESINKLPDMLEIRCNAGDRPTFVFTIEASWQLSSDAPWCKFITHEGEVLDTSGSAGTNIITLKITDENIKNEPTYANITIKAGGKMTIIAHVERGANTLYMRLYDVTDTPINSIELGYNAWIPFRVEANFRFAATAKPEWMEFGVDAEEGIVTTTTITGVPGEQTEAYARIVCDGDRERFPITVDDGYTVTFSDEDGDNIFTFPVTYAGMGGSDISFSGPTESNFGWEVSLDGKTFRQTDEATNTTTTFNDTLQFDITSLNDEYYVIGFEKVIERGIPTYEEGANWIKFDNDSQTLSVEATDNTRYGMVMVFPPSVYNTIRAEMKDYLFELDYTSGIGIETLKYDYLKYLLLEFTQHDFEDKGSEHGMYVYHSLTTCEILCSAYNDSAVMAKYGVTEAYTCPFVNSVEGKRPGVIIDPRIESWTTTAHESGNATAEVWYKDRQLKITENEYYLGENKDERMALHLWGPNDSFNESVYVVFKVDSQARKLLVVTPPAQ